MSYQAFSSTRRWLSPAEGAYAGAAAAADVAAISSDSAALTLCSYGAVSIWTTISPDCISCPFVSGAYTILPESLGTIVVI